MIENGTVDIKTIDKEKYSIQDCFKPDGRLIEAKRLKVYYKYNKLKYQEKVKKGVDVVDRLLFQKEAQNTL